MSEILLEERGGDGVVTLTLHRPAKLNALTKPLWRELGDALRALDADEGVRCVVLRGAGERAFSPGNDISEFEAERSNAAQARAYGALMHDTLGALRGCRHPTLALIHGVCVGGGLELAACCDVRLCGAGSRFGVPVARLGLVMAHAELEALLGLVGRATALEILLEGRILDAAEALAKGLVTRVVPDARLDEEAREAAQRIAAGAPLVHRWHKAFLRALEERRPLSAAERDEAYACFDTRDFAEGRRAFLAKETPRFEGR
ncbi:MAG: enoyl-CoA hydratase/isomerase family protein [Anaeromyxobacteraceae bacterium]